MLTREAIEGFTKSASNREYCPFTTDNTCHKEKCPMWWQFQWKMENDKDRAVENFNLTGCGHVLQPLFMNDIIVTTYFTRDSIDVKVNELNQNFLGMQKKTNLALALLTNTVREQTIKQIKPSLIGSIKRKLLGNS